MTDKRYQVFVSTTYRDLLEERQEVMQALLEQDCIPSGMELFPAANDTQWDLIKSVIDDCDYYILILAGRYGSIGSDGLSFTEMEYRYALDSNKPILAFLHKNLAKIPSGKCEEDAANRAKLQDFRKLAEKKLCKYWDTPEGLGSVVSRGLMHLIRTNPAVGWIRADKATSPEAALEAVKLRNKIDELTSQLMEARTTAPPNTETISTGDTEYVFDYEYSYYDHMIDLEQGKGTVIGSWNEIFANVAPKMLHEASDEIFRQSLNQWVDRSVRADYLRESPELTDLEFSIDTFSFETVKVQFLTLGLIKQSSHTRSMRNTGTYWSLTPYGELTLRSILAVKRQDAEAAIIRANAELEKQKSEQKKRVAKSKPRRA